MVNIHTKSFQSFYNIFWTKLRGCSFFNLFISHSVWTTKSIHKYHKSHTTQSYIRQSHFWTNNLWTSLTKTRCHNSNKKDTIKTSILWNIWTRSLICQLICKRLSCIKIIKEFFSTFQNVFIFNLLSKNKNWIIKLSDKNNYE